MTGWIIQGVRGEGKSLCAVGKAREYLEQGRPVATNLDLFLDKLLPNDNMSIVYRLPDKPRIQDFELLPPAYDPDYGGEEYNGLIILDELGTWLNSRSWNDKTRAAILNWLFLSRKLHWDLILLAQDHESIDTQARTTLCDYLVQASRLDRQKIPYLAPLLEFIGFNAFFPQVHIYYVFYGLSTQSKPQETWKFLGKDLYPAYNTNQRFMDGLELLGNDLVDMRATYTLLPAGYLSGWFYTNKLQQEIDKIKEVYTVAARKNVNSNQPKIILLSLFLAGYLIWKFMHGGFSLSSPQSTQQNVVPTTSTASNSSQSQTIAIPSDNFVDVLLTKYKPRLSVYLYSEQNGFTGFVEFFDNNNLVERFTIAELHSLGVSLIRKPYGADFVYKGKSYVLTAW